MDSTGVVLGRAVSRLKWAACPQPLAHTRRASGGAPPLHSDQVITEEFSANRGLMGGRDPSGPGSMEARQLWGGAVHWSRGKILVTNKWAIESAIVSMGSRWGRRGIPEAWPHRCGGLGGTEGGMGKPCGVSRWGRGREAPPAVTPTQRSTGSRA